MDGNIKLPVSSLKLGMFVADLDREWLGTPFLIQGFLIEDTKEIEALRQCCREVFIDPSRSLEESLADLNVAAEEDAPAVRAAPIEAGTKAGHAEARRLLGVLRGVRTAVSGQAGRMRPAVDAEGRSELEAELLYSASVVDDVHEALREAFRSIELNQAVDVVRLDQLVDEVAQGVQRNRDALLWLTHLKRADQPTYDHAMSVSVHLMAFGGFVGLEARELRQIGLAGLLQDIGKLQLDHRVLHKPGALTAPEYDHVKSHVMHTLGALELNPEFDTEVIDIIASHHERFDGSGYPRGLSEGQIRLGAEMSGLVDTYCALTHNRLHRPAQSSQRAMEILNRQRDTRFRATLVDQFLQCLGIYPVGTLVELNTGEVGVVIQQNQVRRLQPRLLMLLAPDKSLERYPRTLDLLMKPLTPADEPYRIIHALPHNAYGIDPADFYLE